MKVLHLPTNIASQISVSVRALRDIGVDARGLVWGNATIQDPTGLRVYNSRRRNLFHYLWQRTRFVLALRAAVRWADVIHYHWLRPCLRNALDLRWIAQSGKPRLVEVWGSDIRVREVASADNPYLARFFEECPDFGADLQKSRRWQEEFARRAFSLLVPGRELLDYVEPSVFQHVFTTTARVYVDDFKPVYPHTSCWRPLIVHSPSRPQLKGTDAVLAAVERLRSKHDFEFRLLHKVAHAEAMTTVRNCDLFLDQFVLGGYGLASIEAMAFGKPVVCYIKDSSHYPDDLPIVNATQENLAEVLKGLLEDGQRRYELGRRGRAYVEKHHDAHKIAQQFVKIYQELLDKRDGDT